MIHWLIPQARAIRAHHSTQQTGSWSHLPSSTCQAAAPPHHIRSPFIGTSSSLNSQVQLSCRIQFQLAVHTTAWILSVSVCWRVGVRNSLASFCSDFVNMLWWTSSLGKYSALICLSAACAHQSCLSTLYPLQLVMYESLCQVAREGGTGDRGQCRHWLGHL